MSKKLAAKAKKKLPAKSPRAATKVVKKSAAKKPAPAKSKTGKKASVKAVASKKAPVRVAAKKPASAKVKKPARPAVVKPPAKAAPRPAAKPAAKPAPKAIASSAKRSLPAKLKRPSANTSDIECAGSLSDDDIRSMPDSDYMNGVQLEFFRQRLIKMREEVLARELDVKERLHQREVFADPADRATAEEEHWLDLRLRERESMLMRKIEDALRRIRDKEYGYCVKTGETIGIPRLLARPTATVLVDVKGQDEKVETHFRDR